MPDGLALGELITLSLLALALGMDAFSLSLGLGLSGLTFRRTMSIASLNGFFHVIMPLLGMATGRLIGEFVGHLAAVVGGALLTMFGLNMIYGSLFGVKASFNLNRSCYALVLFSISVSLDSFSVGLSLGMFAITTWVAVALFGLFSMGLTWLGLMLGRQFGHWMGRYGEAVGGLILFAFGIKFLF